MSDGALFKPEKDFTKEADKQIPEAQELAKVILAQALRLRAVVLTASTGQPSSGYRQAYRARKANQTSTITVPFQLI